MKKIILIVIILSVFCFNLYSASTKDDSPVEAFALAPIFWNNLLWAPQMLAGVDYAQISADVWIKHISEPWVWDNDEFSVNQIGHPYQGSLCFGSARGSGWNFWESTLSTILGSIHWELFMEDETPSKNDLIVTTLGGIAVGEIFYRLSEILSEHPPIEDNLHILDGVSWLLSPGGQIEKLKHGESIDEDPPQSKTDLSVSSGFLFSRLLGSYDDPADPLSQNSFLLKLDFETAYGFPYGDDLVKPYDIFHIFWDLMLLNNTFASSFFSEGVLFGGPINLNDNSLDFLGLFLHYDFIYNSIINLGANSIGIGWLHENEIDDLWNWWTAQYISFLALGSSENLSLKINDSIFGMPEEERRNYDLGCGLSIKSKFKFLKTNKSGITIENRFYYLNILEDSVPNGSSTGSAFIDRLTVRCDKSINEKIIFRISSFIYSKYQNYNLSPDITELVFGCQLGVCIKKGLSI